jgi:hypothetical protein
MFPYSSRLWYRHVVSHLPYHSSPLYFFNNRHKKSHRTLQSTVAILALQNHPIQTSYPGEEI